MKWFLFSHTVSTKLAARSAGDAPVGQPEPPAAARPFFAVHLVRRDEADPQCGALSATIITGADEPRGFVSACCDCLARSELR